MRINWRVLGALFGLLIFVIATPLGVGSELGAGWGWATFGVCALVASYFLGASE